MTMEPLPANHEPYTDKYFLRTNNILQEEDINPDVSIKVFARGEGPIDGVEEAVNVIQKYADTEELDVWTTDQDEFETKEPLMIMDGPIQDLVELETMYLGVLSHHLTEAHPDYDTPDPDEFRTNVGAAVDIYDDVDVPLIYFGARHYHPLQDKDLAGAALDGGAIQTSTDIGSSNIDEDGVGTTPHILTLTLASEYGEDKATVKTADFFDQYMEDDIPRTTLIDTFNQEIDDALAICKLFEDRYDDWTHKFRVDTCGKSVMQGGEAFDPDAEPYETGTGVRIEGVKALRDTLIEEGYGENTEIILSSGFGDKEKARAFVDAHKAYAEETEERFGASYDLFHGIGAGAFADGSHGTADIYAVEGKPQYKTGRSVNIDEMDQYKEKAMSKVI